MTVATPHVLVVDDEASIRMLTSRWLERAGYLVQSAASADEAAETVAAWAPHVVVTDVCMPGHDGLWFVRHVRERYPDTALVVISGDPAAGPAVVRANLGPLDYLEKPFPAALLLEAVDRGARWHEERVVDRLQDAPAATTPNPAVRPPSGHGDVAGQASCWKPSPTALRRIEADVVAAGPH